MPKNSSSNKVLSDNEKTNKKAIKFRPTPGTDPRFQQTNQSLRCYVMYTDFYRCEKIIGKDEKACKWFKDTFEALCPKEWIERWDNLRIKDPSEFRWHKEKTQGKFPGYTYGD